DIRLANAVGVIDSDYRNAVKVKLTSDNPTDVFKVAKGDRIAQAIILPYPKVEFVEGELSDTERGIGGFGSTGR
ncbi:dUTP diphosphatase, partial [Propionibacterium freudenreichii]|uniref:dUTP diphosphatase n=1 Tax=Propionibacterium freudenreichii TaxID=1744 RepID=UPI00385364E6